MTKEDSLIICHNIQKLRFGGPESVNRLIHSIGSLRDMNSYVENQLTKMEIATKNKIYDHYISDCLTNAMNLLYDEYSKENEMEYKIIWADINTFCVRILALGDEYNLWEEEANRN